MASWMLLAVSKLRIGSGVSILASAAVVFLSGSTDFIRALCSRMSQMESVSSSARAIDAKVAAAPKAAAEVRSLRRVKVMQSPVHSRRAEAQKYHSRPVLHNTTRREAGDDAG